MSHHYPVPEKIVKVEMTVAQAFDAAQALRAISQVELPLRLGIIVARIAAAVSGVVDPVNQAHQKLLEQRAERDDSGNPIIKRLDDGRLTFSMSPETQYAVQREYDDQLRAYVTVDVPQQLGANDFPATIRGAELAIAPQVILQLGPLFRD